MDPKFGKKRTCNQCSTKFMDFNKPSPLVCPHCKNEFVFDDEIYNQNYINQNSIKNNKKNLSEQSNEDSFDNNQNDEIVDDDQEIISLEDVSDQETSN